jgi:enoyl-CoA hydratase/carnithine racemase
LLEVHDGWAEMVLNRPARRNAIEGQLAEGLIDAIEQVGADPSIRAVVLRGSGGAFCSGLDLKAFNEQPRPAWVAGFPGRWRAMHVALAGLDRVLIVALERYAINGGAALALAGDLLISGESAVLQVGEIQIGMAAPNNLAWLLMRHPESVAARLALRGDKVGASELHRLGVVTEIQPDIQVLERCRTIATELSQCDPKTVSLIKSSLRRGSIGVSPREWFDSFAAGQPSVKPPGSVAAARAAGAAIAAEASRA